MAFFLKDRAQFSTGAAFRRCARMRSQPGSQFSLSGRLILNEPHPSELKRARMTEIHRDGA